MPTLLRQAENSIQRVEGFRPIAWTALKAFQGWMCTVRWNNQCSAWKATHPQPSISQLLEMSGKSESTNMSRSHATHKHSKKKKKQFCEFFTKWSSFATLATKEETGSCHGTADFPTFEGSIRAKMQKKFYCCFSEKKQQQDVELIKLKVKLQLVAKYSPGSVNKSASQDRKHVSFSRRKANSGWVELTLVLLLPSLSNLTAMPKVWPAHGSWNTASSPVGGAVERIWHGPPMTNQVRDWRCVYV